MVQQVTRGIRISVETFFEGTYFKNYRVQYSFSYRISIMNQGKDIVQFEEQKILIDIEKKLNIKLLSIDVQILNNTQ